MSFLETSKEIAGLKLRPFTFGTLEACERLNLTLFTAATPSEELPASEIRRQMASFAWVQSAPLDHVLAAFAGGTEVAEIMRFQFGLEIGQLEKLIAEVQRISEAVKAVAVEVVEKPGKRSTETPPPNL